jgi:hypothetical protein
MCCVLYILISDSVRMLAPQVVVTSIEQGECVAVKTALSKFCVVCGTKLV